MKRARIRRGLSSDQGTFGKLSFGDSFVYTLELPWRNNVRRMSCVPTGSYRCDLITSPRFGRCYLLDRVPGRSEVLIHAANFGGDITLGWDTHLQGCIAPCERIGKLWNRKGKLQTAGLVSRPAVDKLMAWAKGESFILEIENADSTNDVAR